MRKSVILLFVVVASVAAFAQVIEKVPHPYVIGGVALFPGGYQPAGWEAGAGLMWDRPHFVFDSFAGYDNGRKTNDGGNNNPKGHDRMLRGFAGYKFGSSYVGAGARWSELDTTNYAKVGWHPEIGVGHDFWPHDEYYPNFARVQVAWMFREQGEVVRLPGLPDCHVCGNGSQGPDFTLWIPSPADSKHKHIFAKMNVVPFMYHNNPADKHLHWSTSAEMLVGYRF